MRRKVEATAPQDISRQSSLREETRTYRFITPVFGGGVLVKKDDPNKPADPVTSVRVPSIRGQLRFWWRAVNPRGCRDVRALREAEAKVFGLAAGGTVTEGTLDIAVVKQPAKCAALPVLQAIAYGAFPLRDTNGQKHGKLHEYTGEWALRLRYGTDIVDDVEAALWAWAHFGGLGGRTRRGFGAIEQTSDGLQGIEEGWKRWGLDNAPEVPWPHLRGARLASVVEKDGFKSGLAAQAALLRDLQELRQGSYERQLGRNWRGHRDAGRSHWPEGDALRRLTASHSPTHSPREGMNGFPRHKFGLPIVFQFKDGPKGDRPPRKDLDPAQCELTPQGATRFASPLILRPCGQAGSQPQRFLARAVRLHGDTVKTLEVKGKTPLQDIPATDRDPSLVPFREVKRDATDVIDLYLHLLKTR